MSLIRGRPRFVALAVSVQLRAFEGCTAEMASYGEGRVFAFARRTDHYCVDWLDVSYARDYPARFSPSASIIYGNSIYKNIQRCDFLDDHNVNPQAESCLGITRVRSMVASGGHDNQESKAWER
jgi:hypothetical protein